MREFAKVDARYLRQQTRQAKGRPMTATLKTISPIDGSTFVERPLASDDEVVRALTSARAAQRDWAALAVEARAAAVSRFVDAFVALKPEIAREITWQMGRPIRYTPNEVGGFEERARYMIAAAPMALADLDVGPKPGFRRFIRRVPLGVVLVVAPWNYPLLTAVNAIVPALMAGNAVILKHSHQTPLSAERMVEAANRANLPSGLFQFLHLGHDSTARLIKSPEVDYVAFTGSVPGGDAVEHAAAGRFIGIGLELGGKDPGYVRADANLDHAIENLVDGAFFNSGQSCCGIERIYVDARVYDRFVEGAVALTRKYVLGDPTQPETTLGPLVRASAAAHVAAIARYMRRQQAALAAQPLAELAAGRVAFQPIAAATAEY
jgi:acyl-CoA reductase-like NAD-dependent aldehyde dehydrogenase